MPILGNLCLARDLAIVALVVAAGAPTAAAPVAGFPPAAGPQPETAALLARDLGSIRPDFSAYIGSLRPFNDAPGRRIYMALVQPGATDPTRLASAPLSGTGARNDIVFNARAVMEGHSDAFRLLLLDHEYFHARHLAGTTSVPAPRSLPADLQTRFSEAAAWGFNVAEARAGRYGHLRPGEFREALDRYRDHYAALKALAAGRPGIAWAGVSETLRRPDLLEACPDPASGCVRDDAAPGAGRRDGRASTTAGPPPGDRARPSAPGRSPAIR